MSKLISALLISVSLIASQTVFAGKPGHTCEGKDGNICNSGTEGCNCKNIIQTRNKD